jgi:hypothetical protein
VWPAWASKPPPVLAFAAWAQFFTIVIATLGSLFIALLLFAAYVLWLFGCQQEAKRWTAPLSNLLFHPPSWPLVTAAGTVLVLMLFFGPIDSFLTRLEEGPWGTRAPHPPLAPPAQGTTPPQTPTTSVPETKR